MLKKISLSILMLAAGSVYAASALEAPPVITQMPDVRTAPQTPSTVDAPRTRQGDTRTYNASRMEPSAEDMQRARENRNRKQSSTKTDVYVSEYGTRIEETHDQNNRLTEIRVTPGTTEIPYSMKNTSERPIDNRPGADPRSTLDTPKFIQFGW